MSHAVPGFQDRKTHRVPIFRTSRRTILRTAGAGALAVAGGSPLVGPAHAVVARSQTGAGVAVFPRHDTRTASPYTEISFRGVTAEELGVVSVVGEQSGGPSIAARPGPRVIRQWLTRARS